MNRGLALALLFLAFIVAFIGGNAMLVADAIEESEACLGAVLATETPSEEEVRSCRDAFERHRFLFSISLPMGCVTEYEGALVSLEAAVKTESDDGCAEAHARAALALAQMKRAALFYPEQIF